MNKAERLRVELEGLIEKFKVESTRHKLMSRKLKYLLFALTGCATVFSSIALKFGKLEPWMDLGVVLVSVCGNVSSSIDALRKPGELWIHERNTLHALSDLKRELEYEASENTNISVDLYFNRMQSILSTSTKQWTSQVQPIHKPE